VQHADNGYSRRGNFGVGRLMVQGQCKGLKVVPSGSYRRALPIHLFRHSCCRMYRLTTMHNVTDRETYIMTPIADLILRAVRSHNKISPYF